MHEVKKLLHTCKLIAHCCIYNDITPLKKKMLFKVVKQLEARTKILRQIHASPIITMFDQLIPAHVLPLVIVGNGAIREMNATELQG